MKKLFIAALFAVSFMTSAFATGTKVSSAVLSNFKFQFKNVSDVDWKVGEGFAKATFVYNQVRTEAFYSPTGEMIGTSKGVTLDQLPVKAKRNFSKKYDGYNVTEAIRFDGTDEAAYYISAENEKESVIVKVNDIDEVSLVKRTKK
jgi:hypothetical protein